ncbi:MAG TPA: 50S ribosomal protein L18 [Candidatus Marinimicrobia bacterium]|jgi:large subunit ribosomal protein L18|nr:50S ribosomal protein L18 [Candidatus Neomarinimicrobiota bacterium]MDP6229383.1 50S ribosomal protein L18 [Candidatus Neomarinimicrobiota bacterium]MDP7095191.1 50S ribosomal protein L18 [Candidatus Neomarinimicrobiota bacterium]MDP7512488.1 50S ribosomal protein L18 [Candidatus Neomarinimicrobiota bacterium]HBR86294.1 50S ribosomal protein L18 [Candidatus Neomarinimicrobiota bacterium]|tara:strand:+ start:1755 stop:2126 length:372 start_codon:yes stop_codon:yes gene_type:complete
MSRIKAKNIRFARRRNRSKQLNRLQSDRFRLVVTRSLKNISAQIVDDSQGITLTSASSMDKNLQTALKKAGSKVEQGKMVGEELATRAKAKNIEKVIFDRNGFPYHGRVKALADGAREGGLVF